MDAHWVTAGGGCKLPSGSAEGSPSTPGRTMISILDPRVLEDGSLHCRHADSPKAVITFSHPFKGGFPVSKQEHGLKRQSDRESDFFHAQAPTHAQRPRPPYDRFYQISHRLKSPKSQELRSYICGEACRRYIGRTRI